MHRSVKCILRLKNNLQCVSRCTTGITQKVGSHQDSVGQDLEQQTFGQPTPETHPHLLKENELVPGLQLKEFKTRRSNLLNLIAKRAPLESNPHIVILPSASKAYMSDKIPYVFRQNTDFFYLTGCQEPDSILVLTINNGNHNAILFMRYKDAHAELWDGPRTGVTAAQSLFGVDQTYSLGEFEHFVSSFLNENKKSTVWYDTEDLVQPKVDRHLNQVIKLADRQVFNCPKMLIHQLRIIKSPNEINLMKKSCAIASAAISKTVEVSHVGMSEHQLFAIVDYECRKNGAEFLAYPPVVAGGKNATTIHYISNNQIINDTEMVLMDAGCEYHGYTSDITRSWPIGGTFTKEQRILYEIVLEVQKILIQKLEEMPSLDMLYHDMCQLLSKRLQEELLIPKDFSGNKLLAATYSYCPHHVSHYLGMDVHDTSKISRSIRVQPGMVVTVEPGIYVNPRNNLAPSEFHNLGVRIEDDILIEESGPVNLTASCPKEVVDIEALAKKNRP